MNSKFLSVALLAGLSAAGYGCQGDADSGSQGQPSAPGTAGGSAGSGPQSAATPEQVLASAACQKPAPGVAPLRRLSNAEYRNTVQDLLAAVPNVSGAVATATKDFVQEAESLGFRNNTAFLGVSSLVAQGFMDAAESLAPVVASTGALLPCTTEDAACAKTFVETFGKRAFRRPLLPEEVARYTAVYDKAQAEGYGFQTGVEWVVFAMLQSTQFLYRVELGAPRDAGFAPSQYETANRLSYLIWQSMPDQALFDAAERGELADKQQIEAQARRLLKDPKASRLLEYFDQWLDTDRLTTLDRDANFYPGLATNLPQLLQNETHAYVSYLMQSPTGSLGELLSGQYSFLNADLAKHYGVTGPTGAAYERVEMPGRSGVLTQGMLLSHDKPTRTSIVRRGLKVRLDMLCNRVPAPPNDVQLDLEGLGSGLTQRQRLEKHRSEPSCAGCHTLMDPIGVVFEGFDAVGRPRTVDESGAAVDTSSDITATRDMNGPVANAAALGQALANSQEARDCYVLQSFRFFYGRDYQTADQCSMAQLFIAFRDSQQSLSELIVSLTQTDQFLYRPAPEAL
jgi:Protein of unknown function (DUF1592)/Protein of unknown function (DUF1588)/Protein of unknown function (DUF1595)/Protein of unknown function (DUF1587)/Protein of unknown function (DUF1585)